MQCTVTFGGTDLEMLTKGMADRVDAVVRAAALKIEAQARLNAPRDTGALAASIYAVTSRGTDYEKCKSKARSKLDNKKGHILGRSGRMRKGEAWVIVGVDYGLAVELYHKGRADKVVTRINSKGKRVAKRRRNANGEWEDVVKKGTGPKAGYMKRALESVRGDYIERCRRALRK